MAQPALPASQTGVIRAICLAGEAGREMTDTEVAAFAAGVLDVSDLQGVVPMEEDDDHQQGRVEQEDSTEDDEDSDDGDDDESDDEGKADGERGSSTCVGDTPEAKPDLVSFMEGVSDQNVKDSHGKQETGTEGASSNGRELKSSPEEERLSTEDDDDKDDTSSSSDDSELEDETKETTVAVLNPARRGKGSVTAVAGTRAQGGKSLGDLSDGDDEDGFGSGLPMTKHETEEEILPLGQILANTEDIDVGTILSLLEADGTIVVKGKNGSKPLDEGSVLSSEAHGTKDAGLKQPMGRIHEIFGPTHTPHYTVRVEGASNFNLLLSKYHAAMKNLRKAEEVGS